MCCFCCWWWWRSACRPLRQFTHALLSGSGPMGKDRIRSTLSRTLSILPGGHITLVTCPCTNPNGIFAGERGRERWSCQRPKAECGEEIRVRSFSPGLIRTPHRWRRRDPGCRSPPTAALVQRGLACSSSPSHRPPARLRRRSPASGQKPSLQEGRQRASSRTRPRPGATWRTRSVPSGSGRAGLQGPRRPICGCTRTYRPTHILSTPRAGTGPCSRPEPAPPCRRSP